MLRYTKQIKHRGAALALALMGFIFPSCDKNDDTMQTTRTLTVENVLEGKPLVQSGSFKGEGTPPVILPGQSVRVSFYAAKGQALTFATMYGFSNDLFFAPENPGIMLYKTDGTPVTGDVSSQIRLWDNGTRINQAPGANVTHPGTAEAAPGNITEVKETDLQGHRYLPARQLVNATLAYDGNSRFTLTLKNSTGGTPNETPLSPGVWAVSYIAGGNLLDPAPVFTSGKLSAHGLTELAEAGNHLPLLDYLTNLTGIFTPLSPVLAVVYKGNENPIYKTGEEDRGEGLKELAQKGNADLLAAALKTMPGVKAVYVLKEAATTVLLPAAGGRPGGKVTLQLSVSGEDRIALATMYGFSNDWFFATRGNGIGADAKGDVSGTTGLFDNGTAVSEYPGAGGTQGNLGGTPLAERRAIEEVPNPNAFTTLPPLSKFIKITLD